MSKISTYEVTPVPKLADKLIGTSVGGEIEDITYNFTLSELLNLFIPNIPANTLQGVLDYGNEATQDIILNGTIFTTNIEVTQTATILDSYLNGETHILGGLYDSLNSVGTEGQVLISTGEGVEWYTIPTIIPTLQQVLASGNTADINIVLSANIQALNVSANGITSNTALNVNGSLKDKDASVGTAGQILSSTGSKVQWINLPVYAAISPLHIDTITKTISIQKAGSTQDGYLSSADWITFDGKQDAISLTTVGSSGPATLVGTTINVPNYTLSGLGGVPLTRTLTINGVTYNLAADRSWTIAAGVSSVTATSPLFSTGGVNPDISIQQAGSSLDGYLSSADWLMFNAKQPAGDYITSLTGEATGVGPGASAVTLSNSAVIGKLLTGLNITGGTVVATDSILTAFGKVQNQINSLVGGVIYKGVWNAATNTPTLTSSVGVQGNYYIVNVAGNTNLNGITDWNVGDWAIFNGSTWNKVDNTDAVTSVNGQTGAVSLTTDNIPEGSTNLYYLNSRARAALSFAAGSGAYNSTTGVITIPTNTNQLTNGAAFITLGSLSASSPLSYNNLTGAFSIQVANGTQDGYLSSTDWNTFNSKQPFLNGTGLVKSTAGTITYITDNSGNWNTAYDNMIVSAAVTGTSTKTLTLTQQDAGTITASWTDNGLTSVGVSMPSAFSVANSPLTSNGTIAVTGAGTSLQYIDGTGALQTFPTIANEAATLVTEVYNETGATLTKGTVVYINGGHGNLPTVTKALATSDATSAQTYGVIQTDITNMNNGHVVVIGSLGDLDTQAYPNGTQLYLSSTTAGAWTSVKQYAPAHLVYVGVVVRSHPTQGVVEIKIQNGYELDELHNVSAQTPSNGNILQYVSSTQLWTAVAGTTTNIAEGTNLYYLDSRARAALSFAAGSGAYNSTTGVITIPTNTNQLTNGAAFITLGSLSATAPLSYNNLTGAFTISQAGASTNGYLSSTDWNTFNDKQPAGSYVPTSRTLNINGTSYDLSADRSWSVGTVTSVAALTLGTTGTDLSSTVATGSTTPVITLNVPTASAVNRGALSAADWSTFNTKVGGVTASSPLSSSGGTTPNITIQQAGASQDGYLSSTDWNTFNSKQAAGNYITSLTGEATASGPGAASVTLSNAAVTGKVLTGINITGGTVVATDSILTGFGKLQNQINGLIGSTIYQGTWNASTNTPTLTSSVGTRGWYYIVNVAGTTNLNGITDWQIGDWAIFDGSAWQKVDNTDAVVSVNGQTGAVSLTTDNIPEGLTNLYFTQARARASLSFAAGSGAYNSTSGLITIPTNTNQLTNGAAFITLASLSGTAPIQYDNTTGAISITQSGTASNGYLSSTDWNTFNNKQTALTNPVTASGSWTSNYIPKINGSYTITNSLLYDGGSSIGVNTNAPYDSSQFKLDVNGGLIVKNASGTTAQIVLIDANPASGGNNAFMVDTVGGSSATTWGQIQTYYGLSIASGALRLQPSGGQVLVGTTTTSAFMVDINGTLRATGQLTLGSTISNGTYTYTLPGATGTLALTSQIPSLTGYITGSGTVNYLPKFTTSSNIGNSIISESGSTISVEGNIKSNNGGLIVSGDLSTGGFPIQKFISLRYNSNDRIYTLSGQGVNSEYLSWQAYLSNGTTRATSQWAWYTTASGAAALNLFPSGNVAIGNDTDAGYTLDVQRGGTARIATSVLSADYRFEDSGYITYNTLNASGKTFTLRNYGTTVLSFDGGNNASFSNAITTHGDVNVNNGSVYAGLGGPAASRGFYAGNSGYQASFLYNNTTGNLDISPRSGYNTYFTSGYVGIGLVPTINLDITASGGVGGYTGFRLKYGTSNVQSFSIGQVTAGNGAWLGLAQYNNAGYWQTEGTAASVLNFGSDGAFSISTNAGLTANTNYNLSERFRVGETGVIGVGVQSLSGWDTTLRPIEVGQYGNFYAGFNGGYAIYMGSNAYYNAGWKYSTTGGNAPILMDLGGGTLTVYNAPTGTAGASLTFTKKFAVQYNGRVAIGNITPADMLDINGSLRIRANTPDFSAVADTAVIDYVPTSIFSTNPQMRIASLGPTGTNAGIKFIVGTISVLTDAMFIAGNGNTIVGGTTDAGYKLDVIGTGRFSGNLTASGTLSIGTTSNNYKFSLKEGGVGGAPLFAFIGNASNSSWMRGYWLASDETTQLAQLSVNGTNTMYFGTIPSTPLIFTTNNSERVRIAGGGAISMTTGTNNGLSIYGDTGFDGGNAVRIINNAYIYGRNNLVLTGRLDGGNDAWSFGTGARNSLVFNTNVGGAQGAQGTEYYSIQLEGNSKALGFLSATQGGSPILVMNQSGNLSIGTTTDNGYKINISTAAGGVYVANSSNTDNIDSIITYTGFTKACYVASVADSASGNGFFYYGQAAGVKTYAVYPNGNVQNTNGSYGTLSDIRIKQNIVDATPKLENLLKVRVVNYNLIEPYNQDKQIGVIAQELEKIFPSMVYANMDGIKGVKYSIFTPMIIKAIQEQNDIINTQGLLIKELKKELENLKLK